AGSGNLPRLPPQAPLNVAEAVDADHAIALLQTTANVVPPCRGNPASISMPSVEIDLACWPASCYSIGITARILAVIGD
ncbi:hypothetical protein ABTE36_20915, partial [Acinetobacter baumannii]